MVKRIVEEMVIILYACQIANENIGKIEKDILH